MVELPDTNDGAARCASCGGFLVSRRYVQLAGASLSVFCSAPCLDVAVEESRARSRAARYRTAKRLAFVLALIAASLAPHASLPFRRGRPLEPPAPAPVVASRAPALPAGWFGPEWPPSESNALMALGRDTWIHPLPGPVRRMPLRESRVFGAVRPGNRAVECRNGHCGVDLGGEIWGEQVRAVRDGVVEFVQRSANNERGGRFVRIAHHDGTVFTQYFHLAAIPRSLERGVSVKGGQVIGLLGDSGVKESEPHLHFSVSIRPFEGATETFIDPEPLLALWPLRVPVAGSELGLVTTRARPAVPLGSAPLKVGRRQPVKQRRGAVRAAPAVAAPEPALEESADPTGESAAPEPEPPPADEGASGE